MVRVFAGDPTLFCGYAQEADACAKAKVPFELVPGISSVLAVPAYAGVPVTDKKTSAVHVIDAGPDARSRTGRRSPPPAARVVLLNCGKSIGKVAGRADRARSASRHTPVAVTVDGTTTQQYTVVSTLDTSTATRRRSPATRWSSWATSSSSATSCRGGRPSRCSAGGCWCRAPRTRRARCPSSSSPTARFPVEVPTIAVEPPRTPQAMDRAIRGPGQRPLRVGGVHLGQRGEGGPREARGAVARRACACRRQGRLRRRADRAARCRTGASGPSSCRRATQCSEGLLAEFPPYEEGYDALDRVLPAAGRHRHRDAVGRACSSAAGRSTT